MPERVDVVPGSAEWLAARRAGVTASDIVTILGLSSYDSAYSLYWRKLGVMPDAGDNDRFALGRALEPYIVSRWTDENMPIGDSGLERSGLYRSASRSWQLATPDRIVVSSQPEAVLECKSWADIDRDAWEDGPPAAVRAQVLWQMDVMDVSAGYVAVVFLPSGEFRSYAIVHPPAGDHELRQCSTCRDQNLMLERGLEFALQLEGKLPPPEADGSAAALAALRARFPEVDKTMTARVAPEAWAVYADAAERADYWTECRQAAEAQLRELTEGAYRLEVDGQTVALRIKFEAQVKAHTRSVDMIRRTPRRKEASDDV